MSILSFLNRVAERVAVHLRPYRKLDAHVSDHPRGKWNYLNGLRQFAHYSVVAGYYARLRPYGSVLDIGCGTGLMQRMLVPYNYSRYLGIDVSPDAIERAWLSVGPSPAESETRFQVGDLEQPLDWHGERFDVIIVNEALYYAEKPERVLTLLVEQALVSDGIVIISMYDSLNSQRLWQLLARHGWKPADTTTVRNGAGVTWSIRVFLPGRMGDGKAAR